MTKISAIAPFTVEANHPRNSDILIQSLTGVCDRRLRSRIKSTIKVIGRSGKSTVKAPVLKGEVLPELVGMRMEVCPAELTVRIFDPLADNQDQQEELRRYMNHTRGVKELPRFVQEKTYKLDVNRMKTLCEEILLFIKNEEMERTSGPEFDQDDCDALPGKYLQNPGALVPNGQPQFRDDMPAYQEKLLNAGM